MDMQRIQAMQQMFQQRPQNPQISLARRQGQIMSPNYNSGNGIAALRSKFNSFSQPTNGRPYPVIDPGYETTGPGRIRPRIDLNPEKPNDPQLGGPGGLPDAGQVVGTPNPGIDIMRSFIGKNQDPRLGGPGDFRSTRPIAPVDRPPSGVEAIRERFSGVGRYRGGRGAYQPFPREPGILPQRSRF